VEVVQSPSEEVITSKTSDTFMIAVYADDDAKNAIKSRNARVLPITEQKYSELSVSKYTLFTSEDKGWETTFPKLAAELEAYNAQTKEAAELAGEAVSLEKFVAYKYDTALAQLLGNVLPQGIGLVGFVLAALLGAVVSSLAAMLNAASTIFTMDVYKKYLSPQANQENVVRLGRVCVAVFTVIAIGLAPMLGNPKISNSIFTIIQESQGFISPGILAVFVFGLLIHKAPRFSGVIGLLTSIVSYGLFKAMVPQIQFLNRQAICFGLCLIIMLIVTLIRPLTQPVEFKVNTKIQLHSSKPAMVSGGVVVILTLLLYFLFSPWGLLQ
jgi:SSS family solute:Na+ symporter